MSFRRAKDVSPLKGVEYNSEDAKSFLDMYKSNMEKELVLDSDYVPSKRFAPSSIRCKRQQWFRLRGTKPDKVSDPDVTLNFIAGIGTHVHRVIQSNLSKFLGEDWIDVEQYLLENPPEYTYTLKKDGYETRVTVEDPPVRFSCDGLVRINGKVHLLEIKTSEAKSMRVLVSPKEEHLDQVKCYCTLMGLDDAVVVYQDRQYGSMKCFTYHMQDKDKQRIVDMFEEVQDRAAKNMIPESLPYGDKWCNSSYCKYYRTCKRWGR